LTCNAPGRRRWRISDFPVFERLALTVEQVRDPELDLDRLAIAVKPSDSRAEKYVAEYGDRCWKVEFCRLIASGRRSKIFRAWSARN
jgi:hypothetical protein